ncbi:MAG: exopolysaccharide biosynthesis protein [Erysipelotrichia bacterium]|nr:exopolysaccharide biosynthesis protein [Erysipelotrichia bacterium]NCC55040.1 exopolysaccharide biosynthesis protein [Erysipelotrichia bacterium]
MIFVTLGTQDKTFERLLKKLDEMIEKGILKDEIIVQAGSTKYQSKHMQIFDFIDMDTFNHYIEDCDFMITHAGVGTIINGINHGKKVLAVARREKYGEHENDHQVEITTKFNDLGYIVGCTEVDEIEEKFPLLDGLKVKPYASNNQNFCRLIEKLIK